MLKLNLFLILIKKRQFLHLNLTGCSIPTVMNKTFLKNNGGNGKGLLVGITMGFGLDIVEVERVDV